MVENSTSSCEPLSGWFFHHWAVQTGLLFSERGSIRVLLLAHVPIPRDMTLHPHLAWMPLKRKPVARGRRAPRALSSVGWFFPLPWLAYAAGSVEPEDCHLVLAAAQVPLATMHEDGQNGSTHATTPDGPAAVEPVGTWPRSVVRALPPPVGRSDSPAR